MHRLTNRVIRLRFVIPCMSYMDTTTNHARGSRFVIFYRLPRLPTATRATSDRRGGFLSGGAWLGPAGQGSGLGERDQPPVLRVPQLELNGPQAVPQRQRRHLVEDGIVVVRALQVVVGDPSIQVVDVVQSDVAGEKLERLGQFQIR